MTFHTTKFLPILIIKYKLKNTNKGFDFRIKINSSHMGGFLKQAKQKNRKNFQKMFIPKQDQMEDNCEEGSHSCSHMKDPCCKEYADKNPAFLTYLEAQKKKMMGQYLEEFQLAAVEKMVGINHLHNLLKEESYRQNLAIKNNYYSLEHKNHSLEGVVLKNFCSHSLLTGADVDDVFIYTCLCFHLCLLDVVDAYRFYRFYHSYHLSHFYHLYHFYHSYRIYRFCRYANTSNICCNHDFFEESNHKLIF